MAGTGGGGEAVHLKSGRKSAPLRRSCTSSSLADAPVLSMATHMAESSTAREEPPDVGGRAEFEGAEKCPICCSILHTSDHSLPRLACKTCRHKFHGACLYKWFSTSNKSTCPLCQTPF
uniref:E3 ubiquitin-protein ligase listerin n=1 Tax=Setaria viridis TaxID=4556 RepID=A0A4U6U117_SETVI|nr:hypothetical protein SEVIR_7G326000v2 [Setaria viridis]